jgi:hypothetical protein
VRMKGLEPPRREAPDPKSGAATNYATSAFSLGLNLRASNIHFFSLLQGHLLDKQTFFYANPSCNSNRLPYFCLHKLTI